MIFSAPVDSDPLDAMNWTQTNAVEWTSDRLQVRTRERIEGNVVQDREGRILNILRDQHPFLERRSRKARRRA